MLPKKEMIGSYNKTCNNDSKQPTLPHDMIRLILERLSFVDFHRARCVSSEWYSTSKTCKVRTTNPWLVLFPENNNDGSCKLFDPHENKTYTIRDIGFDFNRSRCLASSGNWFLMLDHGIGFHLLNIFTRETITLPPLKPWNSIGKAVFWVDERTGDYLVVRKLPNNSFAYHKKGVTNSWKVFQPLKIEGCVDMVIKENKLYVLSLSRNITVFDFSDSLIECASFQPPNHNHLEYFHNLAVTLSGEVLILRRNHEWRGIFTVYKMDHKSLSWSIIKSLGDEVLLLDLGITVVAKDGFMRNCVYFSNSEFQRDNVIKVRNEDNCTCAYDIETRQVFKHLTDSSPIPFKDARWLIPTFGSKRLLQN